MVLKVSEPVSSTERTVPTVQDSSEDWGEIEAARRAWDANGVCSRAPSRGCRTHGLTRPTLDWWEDWDLGWEKRYSEEVRVNELYISL